MLDLVLFGLILWALFWTRSVSRRVTRLQSDNQSLLRQISALEHQMRHAEAPEPMPSDMEAAPDQGSAPDFVPEIATAQITPAAPLVAQDVDVTAAPHIPEETVAAEAARPPAQDAPIVFRAETGARLARFLRENWVYVISAVSLALAGVFLVQYGIEQGLISPTVRVLGAVGLGAALVVAGEYLRRRFGDAPDSTVAYLPATFSGAGVVVIFAAVMAARQLYGLIGPQTAMVGYVATAIGAVVLGWFNGALLVAVGLLGAAAAPFLVGGDTEAGSWLYLYYALITGLGLAVDMVRRWAWVSVLALALGFGGGIAMRLIGAGAEGWMLLLVALPLLATALPDRSLVPQHAGPPISLAFAAKHWPVFPVRLVVGALLASSVLLLSELDGPAGRAFLILVALCGLALIFLLWADRAEGLADVAALPVVAFLAGLVIVSANGLPLMADYWAMGLPDRPPEVPAPKLATWIVLMAVAMSLAAAWRGLRRPDFALPMGAAAVVVAPLTVLLLDQRWVPAYVTGPFLWALHPLAVAALMVALAARFAARDGEDRRRTAYAALAALSMIALALFILTSATPLTLALAVLVLAAAALDQRFRLPEMALFVQLGVAVLSYRLVVDPGLFWAADAPLFEVVIAFLGPVGGLLACLAVYRGMDRPVTVAVAESGAMVWSGVLADLLLGRWITDGMGLDLDSHWGMGMLVLPWLGMALAQIWRSRAGGGLIAKVRIGLAVLFGGLSTLGLLLGVTLLNPLLAGSYDRSGLVRGPALLDSLALAYLSPALVLFLAGQRMTFLSRPLRLVFHGVSGALALLYLGLEIRRFWQGDWLGGDQVAQGELYTYTLALMVIGAGLLYTAIARRSASLRKIAMAVIAVTIAKVFLIDASGLTGLTRVMSFLGLGLSLAGLAWLNRWAGQVTQKT